MKLAPPITMQDSRSYWYNYDMQDYEYRDAPLTADEALPYIPTLTGARGLFVCYVELGDTVPDAMLKTLSRCVGEPMD